MIPNSDPIGFSAALGFWKLFLVVAKSVTPGMVELGGAGTKNYKMASVAASIYDLVAVVEQH